MIRLYVPLPLAADTGVALGPDQSHYLAHVMRQAVGAVVAVFNGVDGEWAATVDQVGKRGVLLRAVESGTRAQTVMPDLELIIAAVKRSFYWKPLLKRPPSWAVGRVRLVLTERTNAERVRVDRLSAIAVEASEQTGRLDVPEVVEPVKLAKLLDTWPSERRLLFCDEGGDARPVIDALADKTGGPWAVLMSAPKAASRLLSAERLRGSAIVTAATLQPAHSARRHRGHPAR